MKKFDFSPLCGDDFTVLDIETTGLSPDKGGRIIEIGAVRMNKKGEIKNEYKSFFNPKMKVPKKTTSLTGITTEMVQDAPVIWTELEKFSEFIGDSVVVCHNLQFDWTRFLLPFFREIGIVKENQTLDSLKLSRFTFPEEKVHKLANCCTYCNVPMRTAHRAFDDAAMTAECLVKMMELNQEAIDEATPVAISAKSIPTPTVIIKSVNFWKGYGYHREYVNLVYNNVFVKAFYDLDDGFWKLNQEMTEEMEECCQGKVDWHIIESEVLKYTGKKNIKELRRE